MVGPPRAFIEEPSFAEAKDALAIDVHRLDDILSGAIFLMCHSPESGTAVPDTDLFAIVTSDEFPDAGPALLVVYRYDDEAVMALWIERY